MAEFQKADMPFPRRPDGRAGRRRSGLYAVEQRSEGRCGWSCRARQLRHGDLWPCRFRCLDAARFDRGQLRQDGPPQARSSSATSSGSRMAKAAAMASSAMIAGYRLASLAGLDLSPEAGVSLNYFQQHSLTETQAGAFALTLRGQNQTSARSLVGARLSTPLAAIVLTTGADQPFSGVEDFGRRPAARRLAFYQRSGDRLERALLFAPQHDGDDRALCGALSSARFHSHHRRARGLIVRAVVPGLERAGQGRPDLLLAAGPRRNQLYLRILVSRLDLSQHPWPR